MDIASTNMATEHNGGYGLTVYYNQSGAGFGGRCDYQTGHRPFGMTATDLNGDQRADLAVATYYSQYISVWYSEAQGGFSGRSDYPVAGKPWSVAAADFNRDGIVDLAANHHHITTYDGLPGGGFGNPYTVGSGANGYANLVARDIDGDGFVDLAQTTGPAGQAEILWGQAGGVFGASQFYDVGPDADSMAFADFNNDGRLDLAVTNWRTRGVTTLFGEPNRGFGDPLTYTFNSWTRCLVPGDFDGDGYTDLAVGVGSGSSDLVSVLFGDAQGHLGRPEDIWLDSGGYVEGLTAADFDGNGSLDLAATYGNEYIAVLYIQVPEPATLSLVVLGLSALVVRSRKGATGQQLLP